MDTLIVIPNQRPWQAELRRIATLGGEPAGTRVARFMASQAIMLALAGLPLGRIIRQGKLGKPCFKYTVEGPSLQKSGTIEVGQRDRAPARGPQTLATEAVVSFTATNEWGGKLVASSTVQDLGQRCAVQIAITVR